MKLETRPSAAAGLPEAVSVDGVVIPRHVIAQEAQHHVADSSRAAYAAAAQALVVRELLVAEARRLQMETEPLVDERGRRETDEDAQIRALIGREAPAPKPDEAACRQHFEANRRRLRSPDLYEAEHILFAAASGDEAGRRRARELAEATARTARETPERFGALARELSACPSASQGGRLGQIAADDVEPAFAAALSELEPGEIRSSPVETRHGYHVVRLERRLDGAELPFEWVRERIAAYLAEAAERRAVKQYILRLAERADIRGVAIGAARSPQAL